MKILIACEFSGTVREAFKAKGHDVWSCDLLPTEIPGQHIQDDIMNHLNDGWDMMIAHPPCTYLSYAANRWLGTPARTEGIFQSLIFFWRILNADIPKICVENPFGWTFMYIGKPTQKISPAKYYRVL